MDLEENEVVHDRPLPSFSIKLETEITGEAPLVKRIKYRKTPGLPLLVFGRYVSNNELVWINSIVETIMIAHYMSNTARTCPVTILHRRRFSISFILQRTSSRSSSKPSFSTMSKAARRTSIESGCTFEFIWDVFRQKGSSQYCGTNINVYYVQPVEL